MKKILSAGLAIVLVAGCSDPSETKTETIQSGSALRVLRPASPPAGLPRGLDYTRREAELIRNFADDQGLAVEWIKVPRGRLVEELLAGKGDMALSAQLASIPAEAPLLYSRAVFTPVPPGPGETDVTAEKDPGIVWTVPEGSGALLERLNTFLVREKPGVVPRKRTGDLAEIRERGYIRVLTRNNPACYFLHRGQLMGFEYELIKQYADSEGLDVVMVVPPRWVDLKQWMVEGRGDVIAACITVSEERSASKELRFCRPYGNVHEILVTRSSDAGFKSMQDLAGRTVHLRKISHYWSTMERFREESGIDFKLAAVPGTMETRTILHHVESGEFDLTVADSGFLDIEINAGRKLRSAMMFRAPLQYGWVVRKDNPELRKSIDRFLEKKEGSSGYAYLWRKYFSLTAATELFEDGGRPIDGNMISPYDKLIRAAAEKYGFHWCLIAAQMFQESSFQPRAKSWAGAQGLMQLMPATARELGLDERSVLDPEKNIDAGVKYLEKQCRRVPDEVDAANRICFGLAAYNGGYGHLIDARSLARKLGRNPDVWVHNVDYAYTLLSTPEYADKAKYGYCRSEEITGYVRKIIARYAAYKTEIERLQAAGD